MNFPMVVVHSIPPNVSVDQNYPYLRINGFPLEGNGIVSTSPSAQAIQTASMGRISGKNVIDIDFIPGNVDINVTQPRMEYEVVGNNVDLLIS